MNFSQRGGANRGFSGSFANVQGQGGAQMRPGFLRGQQMQNGGRGSFSMQHSHMPFQHSHSEVIPAITTILVWTFLIFGIMALAKHLFANKVCLRRTCSAPQAPSEPIQNMDTANKQ